MSAAILSLKDVGYKPSSDYILQQITFDIQKGEKVTLTGPSGSGKSTLLKLIGSILTPSEGLISYNGVSISELEPTNYRKEVSYFFQNAQLFDQTVKDNLSFPYKIREESFSDKKAKDYLKRVKLSETYLDKPIKELSGGEKQRVALVRNLLFQPKVLLLDEVTSSLDAENRQIIMSMIHQMNEEEQVTILMITHDEHEIAKSDRVIRITDGQMEDVQ